MLLLEHLLQHLFQQLEGQKFLAENSASVYIQKVCPSLMDPFSTVFEFDHVFLQ